MALGREPLPSVGHTFASYIAYPTRSIQSATLRHTYSLVEANADNDRPFLSLNHRKVPDVAGGVPLQPDRVDLSARQQACEMFQKEEKEQD